MTEEMKIKRDALAEKYCLDPLPETLKKELLEYRPDNLKIIQRMEYACYRQGFDHGFALAMEEAKVLVECLKVVGNYLYFMGDELSGDDFVGDGALTKRYNEKLNLIEQALKEFKAKVGE